MIAQLSYKLKGFWVALAGLAAILGGVSLLVGFYDLGKENLPLILKYNFDQNLIGHVLVLALPSGLGLVGCYYLLTWAGRTLNRLEKKI